MKTNADNSIAAKNHFICSRPDHIDTAHENEAMDEEFTTGQNPDTTYRNQCDQFSEDSYEIIESGLNLADDNTSFSTYDQSNPYDSYNFYLEDEKYSNPPYKNLEN
jgi:hypothetical protein